MRLHKLIEISQINIFSMQLLAAWLITCMINVKKHFQNLETPPKGKTRCKQNDFFYFLKCCNFFFQPYLEDIA